MKKILLKFKQLKNRVLERRIYRHYFVCPQLFEDVDLDKTHRCSFSLKHHLEKLF